MLKSSPAWMFEAKPCDGLTHLWYPNAPSSDVAKAKAVCNGHNGSPGCPYREDCLRFAIDNKEDYGVWGGTSERDRRKIQRARKKYKNRTIYSLEDARFPHVRYVTAQRVVLVKRRRLHDAA